MSEGIQGFGGLGFSSSTTTNDTNSREAPNVASDMIKQLMQQCLAYHEEQRQHQQNPTDHGNLPSQSYQSGKHKEGPFGFQAGGEERFDDPPNDQEIPHTVMFVDHNNHQLEQETTSSTNKDIHEIAEEGRSRANAILAKFQKLTQEHGGIINGASDSEAATSSEASQFRIKREQFLEQENQRKHKFLLKNLEYVGKRQDRQLQQQLTQLNEAQQYEKQMQVHYQQALEQRKQRLLQGHKQKKQPSLNSQAGIGTSKRQRVEQHKSRKEHLPFPNHHHNKPQDTSNTTISLAVYLSGLPTDGSLQDDTLRPLFQTYGSIRKIHFYRNKQTEKLKGDALVIYQVEPEQKDQVLRMVCSQVRFRDCIRSSD